MGGDLANKTPLRFLAAGYADPHVVRRLGRARLTRFIYRHSRGAWGEDTADNLLATADATLVLWDGELDYSELAEDIAIEARLALTLTSEVKDLDERMAALMAKLDPRGTGRRTPTAFESPSPRLRPSSQRRCSSPISASPSRANRRSTLHAVPSASRDAAKSTGSISAAGTTSPASRATASGGVPQQAPGRLSLRSDGPTS